jgi:hypothetical protein
LAARKARFCSVLTVSFLNVARFLERCLES